MNKIDSSCLEYIKETVPEEDIFLNEPMKMHTTFRAGGEAAMLLRISSIDQLVRIVPFLTSSNQPFFVKGNGSNLLVSDKGYDGVILELSNQFNDICVINDVIRADAGAMMSQIANKALAAGLGGFEFASGIPGTIGGGTVMNAGAYGGELKDVIDTVTVLNSDGSVEEIANKDMEFGYRTSILKTKKAIVLSVTIKLSPKNPSEIEVLMNDLNQRRRDKQPLEYPSAGSTFKRPEGYFAGKLIMDSGLADFTVGGAAVSPKHCGFVINKGKATATDIYKVICEVQNRVKKDSGVLLEPEIIMLGDF